MEFTSDICCTLILPYNPGRQSPPKDNPTVGLVRSEKAFVDRQKQNIFAGLELFQYALSSELESQIITDIAKMMAAGRKGLFRNNLKIQDTYLEPAATRSSYGRHVSLDFNTTFHHRHSPAIVPPRPAPPTPTPPRHRTVAPYGTVPHLEPLKNNEYHAPNPIHPTFSDATVWLRA